VVSIPLAPQGNFTRGTGRHSIVSKLVVKDVPVHPTTGVLDFKTEANLVYEARLYELKDKATGLTSSIVPNWFGVAIPDPDNFDITGDVYVLVYFHPTPQQQNAGYSDTDYLAKSGTNGTDWKQLYAYVDRLGGQAAGAIEANAPRNRIVVFPFLKTAGYTITNDEWFNVIHEILKDINTNLVQGICTRPKKVIVGTLSNGAVYLNKFLLQVAGTQHDNKVVEVWDFDSEIATTVVNPLTKRLRAYWQGGVPASTAKKTYIHLPEGRWAKLLNGTIPTPNEIPPFPPNPPNSTSQPDQANWAKVHHYIRDTMFLDAVVNIEADNA
jgi:hypothetical protein